jgi:hypothetical protein
MCRTLLVSSAIGLGLLLQGCADTAGSSPSFLGMAPLLKEEAAAAPAAKPSSKAVEHVSSNKVLGAMAFQKVTGRAIDPERLVETSR